MPKEIVDVSTYQGEMDFSKTLTAGAEAVIIRAGSCNAVTGECYMDNQFIHNDNYSKAGYPGRRITYWYMRPNHDGVAQADYYYNLIAGLEPMLVVVLTPAGPKVIKLRWACDIEEAGSTEEVRKFCERMSELFPDCEGLIYTNYNTWQYKLTGAKAWAAAYLLWVADWTPPMNLPPTWTEYLIHQYAVRNDGHEYGATSLAIDHDWGYFEWPPQLLDQVNVRVQKDNGEVYEGNLPRVV